ncbi:DUF4375 domain-containing protein [uncultured Paludibaculum sp.]|uniref:DMP19 family protein n=1 Tax=uncultured Paludibaculum sp. TaxID=1765020 RepID=UPI002AAA9564|nr:DUF4375 domain-containing protein [uncultured Paludibaculum sp.]
MNIEKGYWSIVEPIWDAMNIYGGPEVFLATFRQVQRDAGLLYAAHFCQSELCNGGFNQFFFNSTGVLAPEALEAFEAIGQIQIANILAQAMASFGSTYLRDRQQRRAALDRLPADCFEELDERFFALIDNEAGGFDTAADGYAARVVDAAARKRLDH